MRIGIRGKQFLLSVLLIIIVVLTSGLYVEHELRLWLDEKLENELLRLAKTSRQVLENSRDAFALEDMDRLADRLGETTTARVTIIAADGTVLGDSSLGPDQVKTMENHGSRPEVKKAIERGWGMQRHFSSTLHKDMFYLAVPFQRADATGFLRVAMPMTDIDLLIHRLRLILIFAALIALVVAVALSGLSSHYMSRTLKDLVESARTIARGGDRKKIRISSNDEVGGLAGTINRLMDEVESVVSALATERDRFIAVLEGMSDAVLALGEDERITLVNHAALSFLDLTEAPVGRTLVEVIRVPALKEMLAKSASGEAVTGEFDLPGHQPRRVLVRVTPLRAAGGHVLVFSDITELRRLETVRRDFVANVSHELRTPVSVIRANAETLLCGALDEPERARVFIEATHRNAERLSSIIADLLDLSRIESGRLAMDIRKTPIEPVIRRAAEMMDKAAREKRHEVVLEIETGITALADAKALEQVLLNFLDNAVKYTQPGGRIVVCARSAPEGARIEISDNGPGIEMRHRARIFERFYRVDPGRSRELGGTGLGLSIVKHLVEVMGGRVGVESASPQGSIFWVLLKQENGNSSKTAPAAPSY